jgi:hypothetical protein
MSSTRYSAREAQNASRAVRLLGQNAQPMSRKMEGVL